MTRTADFSLFSIFPRDIFRIILQYLSMEDIGILDTSIVNSSTRSNYLQTLQGLELMDINNKNRNHDEINWLLKRKVNVTNITSGLPWSSMEIFHEVFKALVLQNSDTLHSISLTGCSAQNDFYSIFKNCRHLSSVHLAGSSVTDAVIQDLLDSDFLPLTLTSLDLSQCLCFQFTPNSFVLIFKKCPNIQHLGLNYHHNFLDSHVLKLMEYCPHIRTLDLSGTSITDRSVNLLIKKYPYLEALNVDSCPQVSTSTKLRVMGSIIRQQLQSDNQAIQLQGTRSIRVALSVLNPPIDEVISLGVVPLLVQFLTHDEHPMLQYESCWVLTNIASGTSEHTQVIVREGAISLFVRLLQSPNVDLVEQAAWALGNISGDGIECRNLVLSAGALLKLTMVDVSQLRVQRYATWAISNLCHGKPYPPIDEMLVAFPFLLHQLCAFDYEVQLDACYSVSYLSDGEYERIEKVVEAGFMPPIVNILRNARDTKLKSTALCVINNVLNGDERHKQVVLDLDILPIFLKLLDDSDDDIKRQTCTSISKITASTIDHIQAIINAQLIPKIIKLGCSSPPLDLHKVCLSWRILWKKDIFNKLKNRWKMVPWLT